MYQRCALAASVVIQSWTSMTLSTVSCHPPPTTRSTCWPNTGWGIRMSAGLYIHPSLEWNNTLHKHLESARRIFLWLIHPARWTLSSNWSENSFVMDVYENVFFLNPVRIFCLKHKTKSFYLIDKHYIIMYRPIRSERSDSLDFVTFCYI